MLKIAYKFLETLYQESQEASGSAGLARCGTVCRACIVPEEPVSCLRDLVLTVIVLARSDYMYVSVNIWFLCFVIAAVCCCIHVCVCTG